MREKERVPQTGRYQYCTLLFGGNCLEKEICQVALTMKTSACEADAPPLSISIYDYIVVGLPPSQYLGIDTDTKIIEIDTDSK